MHMTTPAIKFYLFGPPHIEINGRGANLRLRKALALFAYLAVTQRSYTRDALAALFWPESDQQTSRADLRRTLYNLKKAVGEDVLSVSSDQIGIKPETGLWTDVIELQRLVAGCLPYDGSMKKPRYEKCAQKLALASTLYAGDFLAGFNLAECLEFDEWQFFQRENLRQLVLDVFDSLSGYFLDEGRFKQALSLARRRLALDYLNEPTHRRLMLLYHKTGQKAAALRQFRECQKILELDLGASPQPQTVKLFEQIKTDRRQKQFLETSIIPKTRFVKSGDTYIAYQIVGEGPVDIVFVSGFVSHLEHVWKESRLADFLTKLAGFSRLILFDKRGVGLSDRVGNPPGLKDTIKDILAVLDATASKRAVLCGVSEGGPAIIEFGAKYPDRAQGLILYGTMAKGVRSKDYPFALTRKQYDTWLGLLTGSWGRPTAIEYFAPTRAKDPVLRQWWAEMLKLSASPGSVRMVLEALRDIDVRSWLSKIKIPTLILHRTDDRAVRVQAGRYLAKSIPENTYVELDGADHWWWVGDADSVLAEIKKFIANLSE